MRIFGPAWESFLGPHLMGVWCQNLQVISLVGIWALWYHPAFFWRAFLSPKTCNTPLNSHEIFQFPNQQLGQLSDFVHSQYFFSQQSMWWLRLYHKLEADGKGRKTIKAQHLWFRILEAQMETGTPYMLYKDHCNRKSNQQNLGILSSTKNYVEKRGKNWEKVYRSWDPWIAMSWQLKNLKKMMDYDGLNVSKVVLLSFLFCFLVLRFKTQKKKTKTQRMLISKPRWWVKSSKKLLDIGGSLEMFQGNVIQFSPIFNWASSTTNWLHDLILMLPSICWIN